MNILLIDEEKFIRDLFQAICKREKVELYTAETFSENAYLINDLTPDYVVVDYNTVLPDQKYLLDSILTADKPTKLVCLASEETIIDSTFKAECGGIIPKPISPTNLISQIIESVN